MMNSKLKVINIVCGFLLAASIMLAPAVPASAAAGNVVLSNSSAQPTSVVSLSGGTAPAFTAGSTFTATLHNAGNTFTQAVAGGPVVAPGTISASFSVPAWPRGVYSVNVTTSAGDTTAAEPFLSIIPILNLSTNSGVSGGQISLSGAGFSASSTVSILFDGVTQTSRTSDANGSLSGFSLTIPAAVAGLHNITASDLAGTTTPITFTARPAITVPTISGQVGSTVSVSGRGFTGSSSINFSLDGVTVGTTVTTDAAGSFPSTNITIPATSSGAHTLAAVDGPGNSASSTITVTSKMTIAPTTGTAGTAVAVTGTGYQANTAVVITFNNAPVTTTPGTVTTNANGGFSASFATPAGPAGTYSVAATDATNTNSLFFTSTATVSIGTARGNTGTQVTVQGAGFKANAPVTITYNNQTVGNAVATAVGAFTATIDIPEAPAGDRPLTMSDGVNKLSQNFAVTPNATMEPLAGNVGDTISVRGTGFTASRAVTVKYDGAEIIVPNPTTNAVGTFAATFRAPISKGGNHQVALTDGVNSATFTFVMDSTAPGAPTLQLPETDTKAENIPVLKWTEVVDPSSVTYNLAVSTDAAFGALVLSKTGLTSPSYAFTEDELLPNRSKARPYYWRVQAVDYASNTGPWSETSNFFVGFVLATWARFSIIGGMVLIVAVLVLILINRRRQAF